MLKNSSNFNKGLIPYKSKRNGNVLISKLLSIILLGLIGYIAINYTLHKINNITKPTKPVVISQIRSLPVVEKNVLHKETIVNKFQSIQKIEIVETEISQQITIKNGYNNNLFKNNKIITFQGIGKYILDLNKINDDNIIIDKDSETIILYISKPIADVKLLEQETQFQDEKGLLTFYDIKLTPEEMENIKYQTKEQMKLKLSSTEYNDTIKEKTRASLEGIIDKLTDEHYKVIINFVA